jgi:hypothetical protein
VWVLVSVLTMWLLLSSLLQVIRWSDATYLEDQDMWRLRWGAVCWWWGMWALSH